MIKAHLDELASIMGAERVAALATDREFRKCLARASGMTDDAARRRYLVDALLAHEGHMDPMP